MGCILFDSHQISYLVWYFAIGGDVDEIAAPDRIDERSHDANLIIASAGQICRHSLIAEGDVAVSGKRARGFQHPLSRSEAAVRPESDACRVFYRAPDDFVRQFLGDSLRRDTVVHLRQNLVFESGGCNAGDMQRAYDTGAQDIDHEASEQKQSRGLRAGDDNFD